MRKTQFAAFLLSGLLVLNTAIPAFAEGITQQAETYKVDTTAPVVTAVSLNKTTANAGETLTLSIEASDDISGIGSFIAYFKDKDGRSISSNFGDETLKAEIELSEYEASGTYHLDYLRIMDKQGNVRYYEANPEVDNDNEELPNPLSFTVKNDDELVPGESDDELVPGQSENRPNKPQRPGKPSHSGSSSGVVVNYDSEKPDPADKKAMEMYDFWQNVKRKIKNTEEGKTLRVAVPTEYTYMPASVMETLRLNPQVSLRLSWGRDTVVIKAGTAQPKQKLKAYWTKSALLKLYTQR